MSGRVGLCATVVALLITTLAWCDTKATLYDGSPDKVKLASWGRGGATASNQVAFLGKPAIEVDTKGYFEGARLDLQRPIDISPFLTKPSGSYLVLVVQVARTGGRGSGGPGGTGGRRWRGEGRQPGMGPMMPGQQGMPGPGGMGPMMPGPGGMGPMMPGQQGMPGPGGMGPMMPGQQGMPGPGGMGPMMPGPGGMGPMMPGQQGMPGPGGMGPMMPGPGGVGPMMPGQQGMPGPGGMGPMMPGQQGMPGPGGMGPMMPGQPPMEMGGPGFAAASQPAVERIRVVLVTDKGLIDCGAHKVDPTAIEAEDWVRVLIPVEQFAGPGKTAGAQVKQVAFFGDNSGRFYVGRAWLVQEDTPLVADPGPRRRRVTVGQEVRFEAAPQQGDVKARYTWDFDDLDGIQEDLTGPSVTWKFDQPGYYVVTLTVKDAAGILTPKVAHVNVLVE